MQYKQLLLFSVLFSLITFAFSFALNAEEKRPMTLEDVMNFHHLHAQTINHNGEWVAYHAWPDRGDGYGILVSADGQTEHRIERGQHPAFSASGSWVLFTQKPPFAKTEGVAADEKPKDSLIVINTRDASREGFPDVKGAVFSEIRDFLLVHYHYEPDSNLTESQQEKLEKAGTPLLVRNLENDQQTLIPFVDRWTVDSLATTLVFTLKDTLEETNGLYYQVLDDLNRPYESIDTSGTGKFGNFTWFEKESRLAYVRADDMEKDTLETATIRLWQPARPEAQTILTQEDAPNGYFLPYDNRLVWTNDGQRLFFGLRPERFAAKPEKDPVYESLLDSLKQKAEIDIWHGEDPRIKTHEKEQWNQVKSQNLLSVYHMERQEMVKLADETIPSLQVPEGGDYAMASTNEPYARRITWEGWFRDIYLFNLNTGEKQLVLEEFRQTSNLSPDGKYLLYFDDKHWHVYDVAKALHRKLTENLEVPFYNETHDVPSPPRSYGMAGWMEDKHTALIYDRYDIWKINLENGDAQNVTAGKGREAETVFRIRKLDDEPLFKSREKVWLEGFNDQTKERAIYSARLHRQGVSKEWDTGENLRLRLLSKDGSTFVLTRESFDVFPDLWVTGTRFRSPQKVSNLNQQLEAFNWGSAELISYHSADGEPLQGIVVKPGNYDPDRKYPVFVYYYEQFSQRLHQFNQTVINHRPGFGFYSSNDYVMLLPDIHFIEGRPGMSAVKSLVPAVQKIIDMGIADPDAIGLHGHSWSGYQTAYVVTQTDIFRAAIAGAPVSNMTSAYSGIRWGSGLARQFQYETGQSRIGASLFEQRHLYIENSPVFYADEINTPLLLMHGDVDEAVPWEQSIEMYLAMRRAGKDVIFLQYRDEPHHPRKYPNKLDYTIRMKEYFDYHLKGKEPADWIIEGVPYMGE